MTHIFIGCDQTIGRRAVYFSRLSALEVHETATEETTTKKLAQWRTESPKGFAFTMVAHRALCGQVDSSDQLPAALRGDLRPEEVGLLQQTEGTRRVWASVLETAEALSPKLIVLRTPMDFTPSDTNRARMEWFAKELAPQTKAAIAWEPHGLWDLDETIAFARGLGIVPIFDAFADLEVAAGRGTAYFVLYERRGLRSKFDDFDMEDLLERCEPYQRAILIFRGKNKYRDARLAHTVWKGQRDA